RHFDHVSTIAPACDGLKRGGRSGGARTRGRRDRSRSGNLCGMQEEPHLPPAPGFSDRALMDPLFDPEVVEDPHSYLAQLRATDRLSITAMEEMEPEFRALVDRVLDGALPAGRMEWMSELAEPLPVIMVARILGLPDALAPQLKEQGYASVEAIGGFVTEERL